jgi:hypothetical protein
MTVDENVTTILNQNDNAVSKKMKAITTSTSPILHPLPLEKLINIMEILMQVMHYYADNLEDFSASTKT